MNTRTRRQATHKTVSGHQDCLQPLPEEQVQQQPTPPFPPQHQEKPGNEAQLQPRPQYQAPLYKGAGKLRNKVALITGGDSGIGRAVAVLYAREGADVALVFLPQELGDAEHTRDVVEAEGRHALLVPGDVTQSGFCREAAERTVNHFGEHTPLKRPAQPEEIAPAFVFFAAEAESSYITGEILTLLGGETTAG